MRTVDAPTGEREQSGAEWAEQDRTRPDQTPSAKPRSLHGFIVARGRPLRVNFYAVFTPAEARPKASARPTPPRQSRSS